MTAVFATAVALTILYVGIRELTQPGFVYDRGQVTAAEDVRRAAPASGPDQLMSIEDMRRLSEQD